MTWAGRPGQIEEPSELSEVYTGMVVGPTWLTRICSELNPWSNERWRRGGIALPDVVTAVEGGHTLLSYLQPHFLRRLANRLTSPRIG
jgi:hypothetical protein